MRGRDLLGECMPPGPRFLWGLALMPLTMLCKSCLALCLPASAAAALVLLSGKRLRVVQNLLFVLSIVAFSLLSPAGKVLAWLGPLPLTEGALVLGLRRGLALVVLLWTSAFSVSPFLRLPGRFGSLLSGAFSDFNRLLEMKKGLDRADLWGSLDRILSDAFPEGEPAGSVRAGSAAPGEARSAGRSVGVRRAAIGALAAAAALGLYASALFVKLPF